MSQAPKFQPFPFLSFPPSTISAPSVVIPPIVPDDAACVALWNKYGMLENIRQHSRKVADIAVDIAYMAREAGVAADIDITRAAGLLHDIAKTHSIRHFGNHAQLGAAWVVAETGHHLIGQGVYMHIRWPWPLTERDIHLVDSHFLGLAIQYADKRVRHDQEVGIEERFSDIYKRYGLTPLHVERIAETHKQAVIVEKLLSSRLGVDLHAHSFDCGRLVA